METFLQLQRHEQRILARLGLTFSQHLVAIYLLSRCINSSFELWITTTEIALECGLGTNTVRKALQRLDEIGLICPIYTPGNGEKFARIIEIKRKTFFDTRQETSDHVKAMIQLTKHQSNAPTEAYNAPTEALA
ncbi:MAG: hypothetical protein IH944_13740 [Armatimonadetes bacterium]|nr:hypothetical protein [Armatimonadota bacterium]